MEHKSQECRWDQACGGKSEAAPRVKMSSALETPDAKDPARTRYAECGEPNVCRAGRAGAPHKGGQRR